MDMIYGFKKKKMSHCRVEMNTIRTEQYISVSVRKKERFVYTLTIRVQGHSLTRNRCFNVHFSAEKNSFSVYHFLKFGPMRVYLVSRILNYFILF